MIIYSIYIYSTYIPLSPAKLSSHCWSPWSCGHGRRPGRWHSAGLNFECMKCRDIYPTPSSRIWFPQMRNLTNKHGMLLDPWLGECSTMFDMSLVFFRNTEHDLVFGNTDLNPTGLGLNMDPAKMRDLTDKLGYHICHGQVVWLNCRVLWECSSIHRWTMLDHGTWDITWDIMIHKQRKMTDVFEDKVFP